MSSKLLLKIMDTLVFKKLRRYESRTFNDPQSIKGMNESPVRFEIIEEAAKRGFLPQGTLKSKLHIYGSQRGIFESYESIHANPSSPKSHISPEELSRLEEVIRSSGVAHFAYTKLPPQLIFRHKAALFENVIVLVMEMDKARIALAPSPKTGEAVHEIYHYLGDSANKIAAHLRKMGFAAQAGHPLMGVAYYPPLAQKAGLGWIGRHGLLITPWYGPGMRIAAIFTNVGNLPYFEGENPYQWIGDFCRSCGKCQRKCPTGAIYERSKPNPSGVDTYIDNEKCFPYFIKTEGCSVCINECTFNNSDYEKLKRGFMK